MGEGGIYGGPQEQFARLAAAQEAVMAEMEGRMAVAAMVGRAVLRGVVGGLSWRQEEREAELAWQVAATKERAEESVAQLGRLTCEWLDKVKEQEVCIMERERELARMAESLVDLTFRLNAECLNSASFEKKLKEVQDKEGSRYKQVSELLKQIERLKQEHSDALEVAKREGRMRERRCREKLDEMAMENESQLQVLRAQNSEQQLLIASLAGSHEEVRDELAQLLATHRRSLQQNEELRCRMEEMKVQHEQELAIVEGVYQAAVQEACAAASAEADVVSAYLTAFTQSLSDEQVQQVQQVPEEEEEERKADEQEVQLQILMYYLEGFASENIITSQRGQFKEIDKVKLEGGQSDFGVLKKHYADARHKADSLLLDKTQSTSLSNKASYADEHNSDSESSSTSSHSPCLTSGLTGQFPVLVSELQHDIEQLMRDTGMEGSNQKLHSDVEELKQELRILSMDRDAVCAELKQQQCQSFALTLEVQQLEHNISLSNGELEKLHGQLDEEKKARLSKETELENRKHDLRLLSSQVAAVQGQLEQQRRVKLGMEAELNAANESIESLQKELSNVLKVKVAVAEERDRLTRDMSTLSCELAFLRNSMSIFEKQEAEGIEKHAAAVNQAVSKEQKRIAALQRRLEAVSRCWKQKDVECRRKLSQYLRNLRKAEEEVDALGDENDNLVCLLEKLFVTLKQHESAVQGYPALADAAKLIRKVLLSRVDAAAYASC